MFIALKNGHRCTPTPAGHTVRFGGSWAFGRPGPRPAAGSTRCPWDTVSGCQRPRSPSARFSPGPRGAMHIACLSQTRENGWHFSSPLKGLFYSLKIIRSRIYNQKFLTRSEQRCRPRPGDLVAGHQPQPLTRAPSLQHPATLADSDAVGSRVAAGRLRPL